MKTRQMCRIALMTALLCAVGPITIPAGPVPLSLATLVVYLSGAVLGARYGALAVAMYIGIGAAGVPVFAGFSGGLQQLAGVTGGFLIGYMPCAAIVGWTAARARRRWMIVVSMLLGTAVCYGLGMMWFMAQTGANAASAFFGCVVPFLPGDTVKIIAAMAVVNSMKKGWTSR